VARLAPVDPRVMDRALRKLGFVRVRQRGSHVFYRHPDGRTTTVPHHKGRDSWPSACFARTWPTSGFRPTTSCACAALSELPSMRLRLGQRARNAQAILRVSGSFDLRAARVPFGAPSGPPPPDA
jgi:predicted RNA binding protein YcfA (HicA-like mRNA interferase family)